MCEPVENFMISSEGLRLKTYKWEKLTTSSKPKGAIILIHGITSHCRYEYLSNKSQDQYAKQWLTALKTLRNKTSPPNSQSNTIENRDELKKMELYKMSGVRHLFFNANCNMDMGVEPPDQDFTKDISSVVTSELNAISQRGSISTELNYQGSWIESFLRNQFLIYGIDLPGHGESEGWKGNRCTFQSFEIVAQDVFNFVARVSKEIENSWPQDSIPIFLMGISFGGALVARVLQLMNSSQDFLPTLNLSGAILLAPALSLYTVVNHCLHPTLQYLPKLCSRLFPDFKVISKIRNPRYNYINQFNDNDPLTYKQRLAVRPAAELVLATATLQSNVGKTPSFVPLLICHSVYDTLCNPEGSKRFFNACSSEDKQLWLIYGMWHMLTKEPGYDELCERLIEWCNYRCLCYSQK